MNKRSIKEWLTETYEFEQIKDIAEHGCNGGTSLIYYHETVAFYNEHVDEIWNFLTEDAEDQGITELELIASFNGQEHVGSDNQFKNLLAWYAIERTAHNYINEVEYD